MKKIKIALLIVLLISMVTCMFACNTTNSTSNPVVPVPPVEDNPLVDDTPTVTTDAAWEALKNAALAVNPGSSIVNFDVDLGFDYGKDKTGNNFGFRFAGAIDTDISDGSDDSEILFEMLKQPMGSEEETLLIGLYYTSETVVMDVTGLKGQNGVGQGKYVVRTQDIDVPKLLTGLAEVYEGVSGGQTIAEIIFDTVLAIDVGDFIPEGTIPAPFGSMINGTIEELIKGLCFAQTGAQIISLEDGSQRIIFPGNLSLIMSFLPTAIELLPTLVGDAIDIEEIFGLVFEVTGMDLNKLEHLQGATLDLIAEIGADGKLDGLDLGFGLDFESDGSDPDYGKYFAHPLRKL